MSRRHWIRIVIIGIAVLILLVAIRLHVAAAQTLPQNLPGDATSGLRLAQAWCADCHSVRPKTALQENVAADFGEIANLRSATALSLHAFLRTNHHSMPNFVLEPRDAEDIVAYILSLKRG
jgi:mono/diheme cytochrome c family protein